MVDLSYSIGIDDSSAQRSLASLKNSLVGLGSALASAFAVREVVQITARFEDLRVTLQTLYRDARVGNAVFADIKDFAKTSAFAVEDLVQTVIKLKTAGIEPNIATLRLFANVAGSVADKTGALQAITDLYARTTAGGLGLEDLNRLADRGIPVFQILSEKLGLGRLEISKFGQTAEGARVILKALEVGLGEAFGGTSEAKLGTLAQAMSNFRDTINNLLDILGTLGLNKGLADFLNAFARALEEANGAMAIFGFIFKKTFDFLTENIKGVIIVLGTLAASLLALFAGFVITKALAGILALIRGLAFLTTAFITLDTVTARTKLGAFLGLLAKAGVALGTLFASFKIAEGMGSFDPLIKNFQEFQQEYEKLQDSLKARERPAGVEGLPIGQIATDASDLKNQLGGLNAELNKFNAEMQNSVTAYAQQNAEQLKNFKTQTGLIRATEEQKLAVETLQSAEEGYLRAIQPLLDQYNSLRASGRKEDLEKLPAIQRALQGITAEYERNLPNLKEAINLRIQELLIVKELEYQQKLLTAAEERRLSVDEALNEALLRGPREAKRANEDYLNSTLTPLARKLNEIAREERNLRDEALKRVAAQFTNADGELMDPEGFARATSALEAAAVRNTELRQQQARDEENNQRKFTTGWTQAFQSYTENATNAANQARTYFETFSRGIEDALVNFVRTGKLSFKDFANNLIAEFVRIETRAALTKFLPSSIGGGSGGGLFDIVKGIGSAIFGGFKANGGPVLGNKPYIVGERGAELFVPNSAGRIVPNDQLGMQAAAVTNVTYSIQAVDAASFRQLVARDPEFLYNVTEQARRNLPTRSRR